jgi:1,4-alpha-glucan branching enzyme
MNRVGNLLFLLHAHLPFVRHPEYKRPFIEENWLNEAILETYIPLLRVFRNLKKEAVYFRITMSFSPTLSSMLVDEYLQGKFRTYINNLINLAKQELDRTSFDPHLNYLSQKYLGHFEDTLRIFNEYDGNLTKGFREFLDDGSLEIITCPATHGFLPFMESEPSAVRSQIRNGRRTHRRIWGKDPKGIWLSECGYFKGLENYLADEGIRYFFVDSHGVENSVPRPKFGVHAPVEVGRGVFAFGRDPESSRQVWSAQDGYPGDVHYREYYRDIGHDLDYNYIHHFLNSDGIRINTGIKYHRITGKELPKEYYNPDTAMEVCGNQATDFLNKRIAQSQAFYNEYGQQAIIVSPYDAELYGHWWYEGPQFIEFLFKKIHFDQSSIKPIHALESPGIVPRIQSVKMSMSSWGENGYGDVWLNQTNEWIYPHLLSATIDMHGLAHVYKGSTDVWEKRVLNQMGRELLLAQSSDWAFIMKTGTMVDYAVRRTNVHINVFYHLKSMLDNKDKNDPSLERIEYEHNLFPDLDFKDWL